MRFRFSTIILCIISVVMPSCVPWDDNTPTDAQGHRLVYRMEETDPNGFWGERYTFHYTDDGILKRINNTRWNLHAGTTANKDEFSRTIEIEQDRISIYADGSLSRDPIAGADLANGLIQNSFCIVNGIRYECFYHHLPDGRLDSISGSTDAKIYWMDKLPIAYRQNSATRHPVNYWGNDKNTANMNLTSPFWGLDENLFFYGFENFCGLYADFLVESCSSRKSGQTRYFNYTKDSQGNPTTITATTESGIASTCTITYY